MTSDISAAVGLWLAFLAEWSLRWGAALVAVALWLTLRPPRRAAARHAVCSAALLAGILIPFAPRWGSGLIAEPRREQAIPPNVQAEPASAVAHSPRWEAAAGSVAPVGPVQETVRRRSDPVPIAPVRAPWRVRLLLAPACALIWTAGVLVLLARLVAGYLALARLQRGSTAAESSQGLVEDARAALGVARRVGLATHPAILSPVALGGPHPLVLVPADWATWPETDRRACLLHELAHLARRDDWAKLAQELIRAPFFFHPLVHWLLDRLSRERELLCDEAVVAHGIDPLAYARVLLACAQRPGRLTAPGLPFLNRGTVRLRIQRLLEDDMVSTLSAPSARRAALLGLLTLASALVLAGLRVHAVSGESTDTPRSEGPGTAPAKPAGAQLAAKGRNVPPPRKIPREIKGTVLDPAGQPVAGAMVVAGPYDTGRNRHEVLTTDAQGRFTWVLPPKSEYVCVVAAKPGFAASVASVPSWALARPDDLRLRLGTPAPFAATLVDRAGKPVAAANVRVEVVAHASVSHSGERTQVATGRVQIRGEVIAGSPVEALFVTTTDADGAFTFRSFAPGSGLRLAATSADGRELRVKAQARGVGLADQTLDEQGFVTARPGQSVQLVASPAARIAGRVVTALPDMKVGGLAILLQDSRARLRSHPTLFGSKGVTGPDGRFEFGPLDEGCVNVLVHADGEGDDWTYRAGQDVELKAGVTAEVTIELIGGVEVVGTVVSEGASRPVPDAQVGVYGPFRPRSGAMTYGARTDAEGRYHFRLPPGETYLYIMGAPPGFARLPKEGSSRTIAIPEGAASCTVPPIALAAVVPAISGRVLDAQGKPVAAAKVIGMCDELRCVPLNQPSAVTDERGEFRLSESPPIPLGRATHLQVRMPNGEEHQLALVPAADGVVTLKVPALVAAGPATPGPRDVAPDELAGVVVDAAGRPLEGARVDAWYWTPNHPATTTDRAGAFRLPKLGAHTKVDIRIRKAGYETREYMRKSTGEPGWVIVLGNGTYFEGRVLDAGGAPVPDALIRADAGPMRTEGYLHSETITETTSGGDGRYRLYVVPGEYDIAVRLPGVGVARLPKHPIAADEHCTLDIRLARGIDFEARVVDHTTGKAVAGVRLWHWQRPGLEGTSDKDGVIRIRDVAPGHYPRFEVDAKGYARWWSNEGASPWSRIQKFGGERSWQRNFDGLDFDVKPDVLPVTIVLEPEVKVTGRVLDPDGNPVAGATVAPALTGTGNSLTGDTRFSVETDAKGHFEMRLPASGERGYNLVAHDGKFQQWRTWANGVLPPFCTKPGEEIRDVTLTLTRPATVLGRALDQDGHPVADREVRASAADRQENRYYDPTTRTRSDGSFELRFIRPGEHFIQVAPFWIDVIQSPDGTSQTVLLAPSESKAVGDCRVNENGRAR